ncbi:hypothetical protein DL546_005223 [Coniochaeta pulveracea]|uniref:Uncharacterized protein n=1 Tax=Coniochaeta pulveracea TaxID=177199 RepID=A0A420YFA0_9PEZI|nr:hypothetical protein DL546_005223 [Coniochaeta pulveracea]
MAFHQPTRPAPHRVTRRDISDRESEDLARQVFLGPDESQTWVLFSPPTDAGTTTSYLSYTQESQQTPGRSRFSDVGSARGHARADLRSSAELSGVPSVFAEDSTAEEDAELDSLDSHLPEFRSLPSSPFYLTDQQPTLGLTAPVLPRHDGRGSFQTEAQGSTSDIQEQLYAFEQFNPRRVKRRRESFEIAHHALEQEDIEILDRNRRIEAWRLEQSHVLLEEIRKETRRRKQLSESIQKLRAERHVAEDVATLSTVEEGLNNDKTSAWHEQDVQPGLWSQLTRKVIRDLIGIDDKLLSILFGEALPDEDELSSTPKASAMSTNAATAPVESESTYGSTWQVQLLERLARELGSLVAHLSSHPGAFSTYKRMQTMPLPYAGLPVIPETAADNTGASQPVREDSVPSMPEFQPTVPQLTQPVAIPGAAEAPVDSVHHDPSHAFSQQEWEQDLDIRLVFRYLRSRFTSARSAPSSFTTGTSHLATSSTQDAAAKAARVRQHHPLVSHAHAHVPQRPRLVERRSFKINPPGSPVLMRHASGSCASQSTRRSARRSSISSRHSSRHFWDIGGSMGTGSMIASGGPGPMGSWGEV